MDDAVTTAQLIERVLPRQDHHEPGLAQQYWTRMPQAPNAKETTVLPAHATMNTSCRKCPWSPSLSRKINILVSVAQYNRVPLEGNILKKIIQRWLHIDNFNVWLAYPSAITIVTNNYDNKLSLAPWDPKLALNIINTRCTLRKK